MIVQPIGQYGGAYHRVLVKDNYAYAIKSGGLIVIDVSDPMEPKEVDFYRASQIVDFYLSDSCLYLADAAGFKIFDITNESVP